MSKPVLEPGCATSIGSLPHTNAAFAAELVVRHLPALPAAPQLPNRSPHEGMLAQAVDGLAGVRVGGDGGLEVDLAAIDPEAPLDASFDGDPWVGLEAFLDAVQARRRPIKLQVTGPITLGLALVEAGLDADVARRVAGTAVRARTRALVAEAGRRAPEAGPVVFVDEPGLSAWGEAWFPWTADDTIDLLSSALAAVGPKARSGVHCCGVTDWRLVLAAGPDVLSAPLDTGFTDDPGALNAFLETGGWVAWGALPTDRPLGTSVDRHWRHLVELWCELSRGGCDPVLLRRQALVTPACGLANHGEAQAEQVLLSAARIAERVHDQATAARLSAGA